MKSMRIIVKVLLCISLIIAIGLVLNYIRNLNPTADGFRHYGGMNRGKSNLEI